jgi:uncharacterized repeat protein (TIGR03803 family)
MRIKQHSIGRTAVLAIFATVLSITLAPTAALAGEGDKVIYNFNLKAGFEPGPGLIIDAEGHLYSTTAGYIQTSPCDSTNPKCGTVFELSRGADGKWMEKNLHNFGGDDGATPYGGPISDSAGNLYGATQHGGPGLCYGYIRVGCGVVYELKRSPDAVWTEKVLHVFTGPDGVFPSGALTFDAAGNLYGAAGSGGSGTCPSYNGDPMGCGVIFELTPTGSGAWTEHVLYSFDNNGADGTYPNGGLIFDAAGNIFGTTYEGGAYDKGTVFEMTRDGRWTERILYSFGATSTDGTNPYAGLVLDSAGNLYGDTASGGVNDAGTVFELKHAEDGTWGEALLHQFGGVPHGGGPAVSLIFDGSGNLYGTDSGGGDFGYGSAFELSPTESGVWQINVLFNFTGYAYNGEYPGSLVFDSSGNIYCPTSGGGSQGFGAVVEIRN